MASILVLGSFLAGSLLTILLPIALLIAVLVWHTRAIAHMPDDPSQAAVHAASPAEVEGPTNAGETGPPPAQA
ncbi:MAG TPA: hypothetical protein VFH80_02455 [Solirubrobacteraceae bacterium]|nr:hypothetical protein [Solirubrobacteraceae bacterium]